MKKYFIIFILAFLLPANAGVIYSNATQLEMLSTKPINFAIQYMDISKSLFHTISFGLADYIIDEYMLTATRVNDMETGYTNIGYYSKAKLNKTAFSRMAKAWKNIESAKTEDPVKGIDDLEKGLELSQEAYLDEESYLVEDSWKADWMGVDKLNYSGFSGNLSESSLEKFSGEIKALNKIQRFYTWNKLMQIESKVEKEYKELENNPLPGTPIGAGIGLIKMLVNLLMDIRMDDYYNAMFSGRGAYGKILKIRSDLNLAMEYMKNDWKNLVKDYESINAKEPKLEISPFKMMQIMNISESPETHIANGEKLLEDAERWHNLAMNEIRAKGEDYLFNAINYLKRAIDSKEAARSEFKYAESIQDNWKRIIDEKCNYTLEIKNELARTIYEKGKRECGSKDYSSKIDGILNIEKARELDANGNLIGDIQGRILEIKDLINRAKKDDIDVHYESERLDSIENKLDSVEDPMALLSLSRDLDVIEAEILEKARDKYKILESVHWNIFLVLGTGNWDKYRYMFNGKTLLVKEGLGELKEATRYYETLLNRLKDDLEYEISIRPLTTVWECNKRGKIELEATILNPNPFKITRKIDLEHPYLVSLNPGEQMKLKFNETEEPVKCEYEVEDSGNHRIYTITIGSEYRFEKVYLGLNGSPEYMYPAIGMDENGLYARNITGERTITLVFSRESEVKEAGDVGNSDAHEKEEQKIGTRRTSKETKESESPSIRKQPLNGGGEETSSRKDETKIEQPGESELTNEELEEYNGLLSVLEKNRNCSNLDLKYLKHNKARENLELMKFAIGQMKISAADKISSLSGKEREIAMDLLEEERYCDILAINPKKHLETGMLAGVNEYSSLLPILAVFGLMMLLMKDRNRNENRIRRILKRIE